MSADINLNRILVVEDDESTAFILQRRLERSGYDVCIAGSAEDGLRFLDERPFDLMLSDIVLPGITGINLCRQVRSQPRTSTIPIILVSARDEVESVVEGLDAGADDYVVKPFHPEELLARVRTHLRIRDLQEQLVATEQVRVAGELAGAAAHEINQPLTILMGYAEMLLTALEGDEEAVEKILRIMRSAEQISQVVRKIQRLRNYKTKTYVRERQITDLKASSEETT